MGRNKHCTDAERELIRKWRKEGKTYKEISELLGRSQNLVTNALKPQKNTENRGRPRKTTKQTDRRMVVMVKKDPFLSSRAILKELNENISARTVRRRMTEANLHGRIARKVPFLSKRNIKQRISFAQEHKDWNGESMIKKWRNILWSDETKINMFGSDGRTYVHRPPTQEFASRYTKKTVKHGGGNIIVWGCMSYYGVGPLYWIKETMTQHEYVDILENIMLPYASENMPLIWTFQQDNDPKHTSKAAKAWFQRNNVSLLSWPSQSPDLNPIENLWKYVKGTIAAVKGSNKQQLWDATRSAWEAIPVEMCRQLVKSMPKRCDAVIKNKGHATKY